MSLAVHKNALQTTVRDVRRSHARFSRVSPAITRKPHVQCRAELDKSSSTTTVEAPAKDAATSATASEQDKKSELMQKIKSYGVAGTLSYVVTELAFWAIALPGAYFGYHQATGEWLSFETDRAQLVGIAAGFVTGVRFAVPLRMGAALALVPTMKKLLEGGK